MSGFNAETRASWASPGACIMSPVPLGVPRRELRPPGEACRTGRFRSLPRERPRRRHACPAVASPDGVRMARKNAGSHPYGTSVKDGSGSMAGRQQRASDGAKSGRPHRHAALVEFATLKAVMSDSVM
jgi:hypothetical protein